MRLIICLFVLVRSLTAYPVEIDLDNTVAGGAPISSDSDNIKGTIRAVEDALAKDPKLPRLTRGEIISLINEVRAGKQVVVVLPENLNSTLHSISPSTKRPLVKRRRKRPSTTTTTVRPVYVHPVEADSASTETPGYVKSTVVTPSSTSTSRQTTLKSTTVDGQPDIAQAAQNLGPDMTKLLTSFGLLGSESTPAPNPPQEVVSTTESTRPSIIGPTVDPSVYSRFKPLPIDTNPPDVAPDMKSILESYGLLDFRQGKGMREMPDPMDSIPQRELLEEMGVLPKKKTNKSLKQSEHVFKPDSMEDEREMKRVSTILSKLREISEENTTNADFNNLEIAELLLLENNTRLAAQQDIDPAQDGDQISEDKNEIKRQQPDEGRSSASASASASSSAEAGSSASASAEAGGSAIASASASASASSGSESASTTPEKPADETTTEVQASVQDLEDSFGGGGVAPAVTPATTTTTTQRPNGFYFLLDWNSFLDVGEDERAVHLNFSPKVGNPRDFISVKVP